MTYLQKYGEWDLVVFALIVIVADALQHGRAGRPVHPDVAVGVES